jgi:hypothetical protein
VKGVYAVAYHVFVDESVRKQYLLCAVWIDLHHVNTTRRALRAMCRPGQRRLHFSKEQDGRRRELLATLATFPIHASLFLAAGHPVDARQRCIQAFVRDAVQKFPMRRADRIVFECRRPPEDDWDRRVIYKELRKLDAELPYEHLHAYEDPMLWAADAIAWAYLLGGDWRRRTECLVEKVTTAS